MTLYGKRFAAPNLAELGCWAPSKTRHYKNTIEEAKAFSKECYEDGIFEDTDDHMLIEKVCYAKDTSPFEDIKFIQEVSAGHYIVKEKEGKYDIKFWEYDEEDDDSDDDGICLSTWTYKGKIYLVHECDEDEKGPVDLIDFASQEICGTRRLNLKTNKWIVELN